NTGTHVGRLWTAAGQQLASATFLNETPTGWQEVAFDTPVLVQPNTTYVVSYYTPAGHYSFDPAYFSTLGIVSGPLQALSNAAGGGDGVVLDGVRRGVAAARCPTAA